MFSYQNKVVGVKVTGQAGSELFDVLINSGYVGSITGSGQGDGAYFVGSRDSSLNLTGIAYSYGTGYPQSVLVDFTAGSITYTNQVTSNLGYPSSGYYDISGSPYGHTLINSGLGNAWQLQMGEGNVVAEGEGDTDPANPYGIYEDSGVSAIINISPDPSIRVSSTPIYYFSDLALAEGLNQLAFINSLNNGSGNKLYYEVGLYELSGSYLVNPSILTSGEITPSTGSDQYLSFNLAYPTPGGSANLFEFDPVFDVNTGSLNQIFTGSGVHLQKDVTFFFDILDQQLNTISSNQQFLENPLISGCVFDVLNIDGTTAAANFFTGKYSRSVTVSALDNENIFGVYKKDFGVRCKLPNSFDGSIFTGVFLAYSNVPNILDIAPNYAEFSGAPQATESFSSAIVLQNDLRFTQMDRYDVYALTGSGSAVNELTYLNPSAEQGYLFSQSAINVSNAYTLTINKSALPENIPHYFTVVPYGALGSGKPFVFGPTTFVTKQTNLILPTADVSAVNIYYGTGFSQTIYKTGYFNGNSQIIHEFSADEFSSVQYLVEIKGTGNIRQLSELKGVINTTGHLTKESVNDTNTQYRLTGLANNQFGLLASGSGASYAGSTYKLQATMI
jgi:hypothetical protein